MWVGRPLAPAVQLRDRRPVASRGRSVGHRQRHQPGPGPLVGRRPVAGAAGASSGWPHRIWSAGRSGRFVVTYQSDPGASPTVGPRSPGSSTGPPPTSRHWSPPRPLAQNLAPAPGDRMIDGALVFTGTPAPGGVQVLLAHPARRVRDRPLGLGATARARGCWWDARTSPSTAAPSRTTSSSGWSGRWRLMATSDNLDQPWLFTLAGDPDRAEGWLHWSGGHQLDVPGQAFDTGPGPLEPRLRARQLGLSCASPARRPATRSICSTPGAPSSPSSAAGATPAIGVARSRDLVHWQVPPG